MSTNYMEQIRRVLTYRGKRGHALVGSEDVTEEVHDLLHGLKLAEAYLDADDDMTENARERIRTERERLEHVLEGGEA